MRSLATKRRTSVFSRGLQFISSGGSGGAERGESQSPSQSFSSTSGQQQDQATSTSTSSERSRVPPLPLPVASMTRTTTPELLPSISGEFVIIHWRHTMFYIVMNVSTQSTHSSKSVSHSFIRHLAYSCMPLYTNIHSSSRILLYALIHKYTDMLYTDQPWYIGAT